MRFTDFTFPRLSAYYFQASSVNTDTLYIHARAHSPRDCIGRRQARSCRARACRESHNPSFQDNPKAERVSAFAQPRIVYIRHCTENSRSAMVRHRNFRRCRCLRTSTYRCIRSGSRLREWNADKYLNRGMDDKIDRSIL